MQTEIIQDLVKTRLSTEKKGKDKFKPHFCGKDFYLNHQNQFKLITMATQNLSPQHEVILFTLSLCCLRRPNDWYAGQIFPSRQTHSAPVDFQFSLFQLFRELGILWPTKLDPKISILDFLATVKIKPVPEAAMSGLFHFFTGDYQLEVLNYEPSPNEVLEYQIQNKRILTFDNDATTWVHKKYGERDVLSFILHDLIHAEHFLGDSQKRQSQIGFYKFTKLILDNNLVDQFLLSAEFNKQFCYLISDMNSHIIHLLKTLRAVIDQHSPTPKDSVWPQITLLLTSKNTNAQTLRDALNRINTPLFSISDAEALLHFFQNELN
jgi:hypothetical protein